MTKHKQTSKQTIKELYQNSPKADFIRRFGAYFFDLISVSIVLIIASLFALSVVFISSQVGVIELAPDSGMGGYLAQSLIFAGYLAVITIAFYSYFWCRGGQTMGMRIFRLRVQNRDGSNISFTQSLIRMATCAFGLGNLLAIFSDKNAFQDLWAECEVVVLTEVLNSEKSA